MNLQWPHLVFLAGNTIYLVTRGLYQLQSTSNQKAVSKATILDWFLILYIATAQIIIPSILLFTSWINEANYSLPAAAAWVGGPLMLLGLWLFWRSHADLGNSWSVTLELNQDHKLVTHGVYRYLRHPMYASFFLLAISQGLLLNNWLAGWSALAATTLLYVVRIPHEEQMMLDCFGEEYRAYSRETYGLIPTPRAGNSREVS